MRQEIASTAGPAEPKLSPPLAVTIVLRRRAEAYLECFVLRGGHPVNRHLLLFNVGSVGVRAAGRFLHRARHDQPAATSATAGQGHAIHGRSIGHHRTRTARAVVVRSRIAKAPNQRATHQAWGGAAHLAVVNFDVGRLRSLDIVAGVRLDHAWHRHRRRPTVAPAVPVQCSDTAPLRFLRAHEQCEDAGSAPTRCELGPTHQGAARRASARPRAALSKGAQATSSWKPAAPQSPDRTAAPRLDAGAKGTITRAT